jgi:hypothetical protein
MTKEEYIKGIVQNQMMENPVETSYIADILQETQGEQP